MAYIGKQGISATTLTSKTLTTMVGNGSTTTLTLSSTPTSVNNVAIYLDGIFQRPTNEYTLLGSTITFTTAPANNVFVCALVGGGEHIGSPMADSISTEKLADGTITNADIDSVSTGKVSGTLPALNANAVTGLNAANLVGSAMPAIDGSNLTGLSSFTKNANDPAPNTNGTQGDIWANTTSGELFVLTDATTDDNFWTNVGEGTGDMPFTGMVATGGVVSGGTIDGDYKYHVFNNSSDGPFVVTTAGDTPEVEYLVIAGGGGGGGSISGGGGGAGGYLTATGFSVTTSSYPITVGAGGAASTNGANSVFSTITATGGGYGGAYTGAGQAGGSGGGSGGASQQHAGGTGIAGQGFAGGIGDQAPDRVGGGGGGASEVGSAGVATNILGQGGDGLSSSITGSAVIRGGGGTGSGNAGSEVSPVAGGAGGGGSGGNSQTAATTGTANTGGGGGGGTTGAGKAGGSGVVIIRYKFQ